ncbi:MAG: ABC transporter permease subunit [Polyangiaceae bacterium]
MRAWLDAVRGTLPILKRELISLYTTPIAWVTTAAFLLVQGFYFFLLLLTFAAQQDVVEGVGPAEAFFGQSAFFYFPLVLICPILTMRLFAEERRSGTIEALLTAPVGTAGVVLGKYLATLVTYVAMWAPTALYMVILTRFGQIDWRTVGTGYLGVFLVGAAYLSVGTLASSLTTSQLAAAVGSAVFILTVFLLGFGGPFVESETLRSICTHISVSSLMEDFSRGLVDSRRLVFWGSFTLVPLYVTARNVESWRWG